jgi:hypothetical protein
MKITKTAEFVGQYHVYAQDNFRWYRCEDGNAGLPEWYLYTVDADGEDGEGEYVDSNPAHWKRITL